MLRVRARIITQLKDIIKRREDTISSAFQGLYVSVDETKRTHTTHMSERERERGKAKNRQHHHHRSRREQRHKKEVPVESVQEKMND